MANRGLVLDGLAWAGFTEKARIAKIAAKLVREARGGGFTKTIVKEAVKNTSPPYGRGKAIFEALWGTADAVGGEIVRQKAIYDARQEEQAAWRNYLDHKAKRTTRINDAYASAFERPTYLSLQNYKGGWGDYDARQAWEDGERRRDKGEDCTALTHQDGFVVCLLVSEKETRRPHIASRLKRGEVVRTYLRSRSEPWNLVEAAVSLGGPKVKAALARGKRVKTDWIGRCARIYHDGSDHVEPMVEEIPWRTAEAREVTSATLHGHFRTYTEMVPTLTSGKDSWDDTAPLPNFNDYDPN